MGKRSDFARRPRDFYPTPAEAVGPLLQHLSPGTLFVEPCAGNGALVDHLVEAGHHCLMALDIEPRRDDVLEWDARRLGELQSVPAGGSIITNPPWSRDVLHDLIPHLSDILPTWLLFDADWAHTRQAAPFLPRLRKIVSVGRVKWIPDSPFTGKDNCAWHLFDKPRSEPAVFYGRAA
jgi:hypothetical protein